MRNGYNTFNGRSRDLVSLPSKWSTEIKGLSKIPKGERNKKLDELLFEMKEDGVPYQVLSVIKDTYEVIQVPKQFKKTRREALIDKYNEDY